MRRFFLSTEQLNQKDPVLGPDDARHIRNVLRLRPGDAIEVFDGTGAAFEAEIVSISKQQVGIVLGKAVVETAESGLKIALAQGYLKDKKMDLLVRRLTELGVNDWMPFRAQRSVPSPDEKRGTARIQRWQKISVEAVKQCHRSRMMTIHDPVDYESVLTASDAFDLKLVFWVGDGTRPLTQLEIANPPNSVFVMIGPEGGLDPAEYRLAIQCGFQAVGMGPRTLRAETATVAACSLVQYQFGDMG